jgi:hypothetical protein
VPYILPASWVPAKARDIELRQHTRPTVASQWVLRKSQSTARLGLRNSNGRREPVRRSCYGEAVLAVVPPVVTVTVLVSVTGCVTVTVRGARAVVAVLPGAVPVTVPETLAVWPETGLLAAFAGIAVVHLPPDTRRERLFNRPNERVRRDGRV